MSLDLAIRVAILLAVGLVAGLVLRSASAAARHAFRRYVITAALALPALGLVSPDWSPGRVWDLGTPQRLGASLAPSTEGHEPRASRFLLPAPLAPEWARRAGAIWLTGALLVGAYFACGYWRLWRVRHRSTPADSEWQTGATGAARRLGLRAVPVIRVSTDIASPMVSGLGRPTILVPTTSATWDERRRATALLHELSHVRRGDLQAQALAQVLCALHWFNPLAWLSARALGRERELACDDEVLRQGVAPLDYARVLVEMAASTLRSRESVSALWMARPTEMEGRVQSLLAARRRCMSRNTRLMLPIAALAMSAVVAGASATTRRPADSRPAPAVHAAPAWLTDPGIGDAITTRRRLLGAVSSTDGTERARAARGLALIAGNEVVPALVEALTDPDAAVRQRAAAGLAWRRHPSVVPALIDAAGDPDANVRRAVLVALAVSGDDRAGPVLQAATTDLDPAVRRVVRGLAHLR